MAEFRTKVRKIHYWLKHELLIFDNIVLVIALILCFSFTWGAISSMSRNWKLAAEVASREREKALLELEVETLELENAYYLSEEYQELAARKYQGKKLPDEIMVYLPKNSDYAKRKHSTSSADSTNVPLNELSNFEQWTKFLFGF